jgi:glycosyltransferase involved in cell wall biosynthesis
MRIIIDMQGAQSTGSRKRGIGRYTIALVKGIIQNKKGHEVILILNGHFSESIAPIYSTFEPLVGIGNIHVWSAATPTAQRDTNNEWRSEAAEAVREAFIQTLRPDVLLLSSLFEGFDDDACTSIKRHNSNVVSATILYDLIPLIHKDVYLENAEVRRWYERKIEELRRSDLCLAISESSRQEGISCLGFTEKRAVNISTDADEQFKPLDITKEEGDKLLAKLNINKEFVMYTGGIDYRKNIEGLIIAYSYLALAIREKHKLVIVCSVTSNDRKRLTDFAKAQGLQEEELIITGYVEDTELVKLYNLCKLFVFPSWHEGFGLPALEAMRCGAPTIAGNNSSLPEVINLDEALFDSKSPDSISRLICLALSDDIFRARLEKHSIEQSKNFCWDRTAKKAISALEELHHSTRSSNVQQSGIKKRRLAYISPIPPQKSGIAEYSAELIPQLTRHYSITIITDFRNGEAPIESFGDITVHTPRWLAKNKHSFDRILYHFGNSTYHQYMFELIKEVPGVVVMHDFFVSGILSFLEMTEQTSVWTQELYNSHGYKAVRERTIKPDITDVIYSYPCNRGVIEDSIGLVIHSEYSEELAKVYYGGMHRNFKTIPHLRGQKLLFEKKIARERLGFKETHYIVSAFGMIGPTKLNHILIESWLMSKLAQEPNCLLIFVGEISDPTYGEKLTKVINKLGMQKRVRITGWVDNQGYQSYIAATDLAVQLRTLSRGETSGTVLDCMKYGIPTIVNAHGSMKEIPKEAVYMLQDEFRVNDLVKAIDDLWNNSEKSAKLSLNASNHISKHHSPLVCADRYYDAIESFYKLANFLPQDLIDSIAKLDCMKPDKISIISLATQINATFRKPTKKREVLIDISFLVNYGYGKNEYGFSFETIKEWIRNEPDEYRIEPVYMNSLEKYSYARNFTFRELGISNIETIDEEVVFGEGDILVKILDESTCIDMSTRTKLHGIIHVKQLTLLGDIPGVGNNNIANDFKRKKFAEALASAARGDRIIYDRFIDKMELEAWLGELGSKDGSLPKLSQAEIRTLLNTPDERIAEDSVIRVMTSAWNLLEKEFFVVSCQNLSIQACRTLIEAFEYIWKKGQDYCLQFIGLSDNEELRNELQSNNEFDKRLFFSSSLDSHIQIRNIEMSCCLISWKDNECLDINIIKATRCKTPVIARNLTVNVQFAKDNIYYYSEYSTEGLGKTLEEWCQLYIQKKIPRTSKISLPNFLNSSKMLIEDICDLNSSKLNTGGDNL